MATIIRKSSVVEEMSGRPQQPIAFNFEDMNDRANEYLESVRREAAKIVQEAHQQAEQVRKKAEALGRATAQQHARMALDQEMAERVATFIAALDQLVAQTNESREDWLRRWEQSAIAVVTAVAERVIRREIREQPEISLELIREALQLAAGADDVTLHLNPNDYELLGVHNDALAASLGRLAPTHIVADPSVTPGGCVVQTSLGRIDQQIESQLARIQEELS
jgi:flagellar assembly protein FliH